MPGMGMQQPMGGMGMNQFGTNMPGFGGMPQNNPSFNNVFGTNIAP